MNASEAAILAVDVAWVNASNGEVDGAAVRAAATVTLHAQARLLGGARQDPHGRARGGSDRDPRRSAGGAAAGLIDRAALALAPPRGAGSTKFSSGQVVVVGGSRGPTGAVCMSASAATRSGAGYATVAVPAELEQVFEVKLTEVMSVGCLSREGSSRRAASEQVLGRLRGRRRPVLGPGIGREDGTQGPRAQPGHPDRGPAGDRRDGLNAHAGRPAALREREGRAVLTPHEGELAACSKPIPSR